MIEQRRHLPSANLAIASKEGILVLRYAIATACFLVIVAGCTGRTSTYEALTEKARAAVDVKLGVHAEFSNMKGVVVQQIVCGHAEAGLVSRDWVYYDGRAILDDDPDFNTVAIQCEEAVSGDNASFADNT